MTLSSGTRSDRSSLSAVSHTARANDILSHLPSQLLLFTIFVASSVDSLLVFFRIDASEGRGRSIPLGCILIFSFALFSGESLLPVRSHTDN